MSKPDYETIEDIDVTSLSNDVLSGVVGQLLERMGLKVQRHWSVCHGDEAVIEFNVVDKSAETKQHDWNKD